MAIRLQDKPNTIAPDATYPYGDIKDDDGSNNGTPVNREVYADIHQFFETLMVSASIAFNGLRDNAVNGFQYITALAAFVRAITASETQSGTAEIATQTETNAGTDDLRIVTPLKLHTYLAIAWETRSNVADIVPSGGSGVTVTVSVIDYKIVGKTMFVNYRFQATNTTAPTSFTLFIPDSKLIAHGFATSVPIIVFNGSAALLGVATLNNSTPALVNFTTAGLTNGVTTTVSGSLTFEIQ
jgi:hypothetical protein